MIDKRGRRSDTGLPTTMPLSASLPTTGPADMPSFCDFVSAPAVAFATLYLLVYIDTVGARTPVE